MEVEEHEVRMNRAAGNRASVIMVIVFVFIGLGRAVNCDGFV